ncbi:MAG: acyl-CoA desaturase, partial [Candidatus Eremiobacteraeota bacterium]|nr:acyl-CoA desaturase [Candidatus Eremiobacteraeota bacterium]
MNATLGQTRPAKRDYVVGFTLLVIHLGALAALVPAFFSWQAIFVALGLYLATGFGITLGYHRLLTHRSLALWKPLEYAISILGVLAFQGGPIEWVATHRIHHANSDTEGDPHDSNRGMPWAHFEWLFRKNQARPMPAERERWVPDLYKEPFYPLLEKYHVLFQLALGVVLFLVGGWSFVVWGIFVRLGY